MAKRVMKTYKLVWSPTGRTIATVTASTMKAAKSKAPAQYRKYKGEMYAEEVESTKNPSSAITPLKSLIGKTIKVVKQGNRVVAHILKGGSVGVNVRRKRHTKRIVRRVMGNPSKKFGPSGVYEGERYYGPFEVNFRNDYTGERHTTRGRVLASMIRMAKQKAKNGNAKVLDVGGRAIASFGGR